MRVFPKTGKPLSRPAPAQFYSECSYAPHASVGYLMKRILGSIIHQVDQRLDIHGLTNAQWGPLLHLHREGRCAVAELARKLEVDAGAMTRLLDRLEKKQLCKRVRSTDDRRVVQVEITPEGEASIRAVPAVLAEVLNAHLAGFSKTEWDALTLYLRRMLDNAEAMRGAE
ncbi:MAG: MarR family transcriptional regulator [Burkholderiales bacterium]|nr:MarR family transcriptional regulator [Burkholderiales bacterium]